MTFPCADRTLDLTTPQVMGILNVTPDSFSDGGKFNTRDAALRHGEQMVRDGATLLDVGGESTRPGASPVPLQEEMDRVLPVVEAIATNLDVVISVDTSSPELMLAAAAAGAHVLNDVRALSRDGALAAAAKSGLSVCLMHMQGEPTTMQHNPKYDDVCSHVHGFFDERLAACEAAGIPRDRILLDPGFGFGKTTEHNYTLLNHLSAFDDLNCPLLVGVSRKRMIAEALSPNADCPIDERLFGSVAAAVVAAMNGARIVRVHDVKASVDALKVVSATHKRRML